MIHIYVDGGASPNPGIGGWAALLRTDDGQHEKLIGGGIAHCTNNAAEIQAAIGGLKALLKASHVTVYSDSQYLVSTMMDGWSRNTNGELWVELDTVCSQHDVTFEHIRGHIGQVDNERVHNRVQEEIAKERLRQRKEV